MSVNFTLNEMLSTSTGLQNFPSTWDEVYNLELTTNRLQLIRDRVGFPIKVNSGYRSKAVNKAVGGVSTSAHCKGLAVDVCGSTEKRNRAIYDACIVLMDFLEIDQLIMYNAAPGDSKSRIRFIHIGFSIKAPRKQLLFK